MYIQYEGHKDLVKRIELLQAYVATAYDRIAVLEKTAAWTPWARVARWWKALNGALAPDPTLTFDESFDRYIHGRRGL